LFSERLDEPDALQLALYVIALHEYLEVFGGKPHEQAEEEIRLRYTQTHKTILKAISSIHENTNLVKFLDSLQEGFNKALPNSRRNVEVIFSLLPISETEVHFSAARFPFVAEHIDLNFHYSGLEVRGDWAIRGDLRGNVYDTSKDSYISLDVPLSLQS
jgi:hypothetical protein